MFIELTNVYFDPNIHGYKTGKLFIKVSDIVSVVDEDDYVGTNWCRCVKCYNGDSYYVTESFKYIVDKMDSIISLMYKKEEDNDWK